MANMTIIRFEYCNYLSIKLYFLCPTSRGQCCSLNPVSAPVFSFPYSVPSIKENIHPINHYLFLLQLCRKRCKTPAATEQGRKLYSNHNSLLLKYPQTCTLVSHLRRVINIEVWNMQPDLLLQRRSIQFPLQWQPAEELQQLSGKLLRMLILFVGFKPLCFDLCRSWFFMLWPFFCLGDHIFFSLKRK